MCILLTLTESLAQAGADSLHEIWIYIMVSAITKVNTNIRLALQRV